MEQQLDVSGVVLETEPSSEHGWKATLRTFLLASVPGVGERAGPITAARKKAAVLRGSE